MLTKTIAKKRSALKSFFDPIKHVASVRVCSILLVGFPSISLSVSKYLQTLSKYIDVSNMLVYRYFYECPMMNISGRFSHFHSFSWGPDWAGALDCKVYCYCCCWWVDYVFVKVKMYVFDFFMIITIFFFREGRVRSLHTLYTLCDTLSPHPPLVMMMMFVMMMMMICVVMVMIVVIVVILKPMIFSLSPNLQTCLAYGYQDSLISSLKTCKS